MRDSLSCWVKRLSSRSAPTVLLAYLVIGSLSASLLPIPAFAAAPDAPTNFAVINESTLFPTVSWDAPAGALTYNIWLISLDTGLLASDASNLSTNSFTPSSPLANERYRIIVNAANGDGTSPWSAPFDFSVGTAPTTVPSVPTNFSVSDLDTSSPTISWLPSTGASSYSIWLVNVDTGLLVSDASNLLTNSFTATSLTDGDYSIVVNAKNGVGTSGWSASFNFGVDTAPTTVPDVPTNLSVINEATGTPTVFWLPSTGASAYNIWLISLDTGLLVSDASDLPANSFTPSSALPDARYRIVVNAKNSIGTSGWSENLDFSTGSSPTTAPLAPTNLAVINQSTPFPTVSWDASAGALTYNIWLIDLDTGLFVADASNLPTNSFTPSAPLPDARYRILVNAKNGVGTSPWSDPFDFSTGSSPTTVPSVPANFSVSGLDTPSPTVFWVPSEGALSYNIWLISLDTGLLVQDATGLLTNSFTPSPNLADGNYSIVVNARNGVGTSVWSDPFNFGVDTNPTGAPAAPSDFSIINEDTGIPTIFWLPSTGASGYNTWLINLDTGLFVSDASNLPTNSFTPLSALPDARYRILVNAKNAMGTSGWSAPFDFSTGSAPTTIPSVPTGLSVSGNDTAFPTVSWDVSAGASSYAVWLINVDTSLLVSDASGLPTNSFTPSSPLVDGNYSILVNAKNGVGTSAWSAPFNFSVSVPAPLALFSGFSVPESNDSNGSSRGKNITSLGSIASFVVDNILGDDILATAAFGGGETSLTSEEVSVICSMRRALSTRSSSTMLEWVAMRLANKMDRDADQILEALKDESLCKSTESLVKASAKPIAFKVNAFGYPVSSNATWNGCLTGNVTLELVRANPDKDEDGNPRDCSWYHTSDVWKHPDLSIYFKWDKENKTVGLPAGYAIQQDLALTQN